MNGRTIGDLDAKVRELEDGHRGEEEGEERAKGGAQTGRNGDEEDDNQREFERQEGDRGGDTRPVGLHQDRGDEHERGEAAQGGAEADHVTTGDRPARSDKEALEVPSHALASRA